jgi:hypothetical protein
MGTITRSFANNITTSGVLLPASLTNASIANVTAYNASVVTGGMVLVSSATASASATIDFTLGSYKEYQFYFANCHPSVDDTFLQINFSTDSGSNYNVTKTSTFFYAYHSEDAAFQSFGYWTDGDLAQSTSDQRISGSVGAGADESTNGIVTLFNPSSTTYVKHFITTGNTYRDAIQWSYNNYTAGYANTTSALTNIRFQMSSGNIDEGTILMYGIV